MDDKTLPKYMQNLTNQSLPPAEPPEAKCWVFMGTTGGAGVTSLCIQTAHELALQIRNDEGDLDQKICLLDLDFQTGACAQYLDMDALISLGELQTDPSRIDENMVNAMVSGHESGFDLFSVQRKLLRSDSISADVILAILDCLSRSYDYLIVDMPRQCYAWTPAIIGAADHVNIVTELSVPAIQNIQALQHELAEIGVPKSAFNIIVNKHNRRSFRNALQVADVCRATGHDPAAIITNDHEILRESINCGSPVGLKNNNCRYAKDVRKLLYFWLQSHPQHTEARAA